MQHGSPPDRKGPTAHLRRYLTSSKPPPALTVIFRGADDNRRTEAHFAETGRPREPSPASPEFFSPPPETPLYFERSAVPALFTSNFLPFSSWRCAKAKSSSPREVPSSGRAN